MSILAKLQPLRDAPGIVRTQGLAEDMLKPFLSSDTDLVAAIDAAAEAFPRIATEFPDLIGLDEQAQIDHAQAGFLNFYPEDAVNPYVALTARGPWIVTLKGRIVYDAGGYGMLGFGHAPAPVLAAMSKPQAMANVMTPSFSQYRFAQALRREIGRTRGGCPYTRFMCLNSGSEAVSLAGRIADVNARLQTGEGGRHAGKAVRRIAVKGGFHGRTELPAGYSDSTRKVYVENLASWRQLDRQLVAIEAYNVAHLRQAFADAERDGVFIEAMFVEPVMGEGDPGRSLTPEFYAAARELTKAHGTLLLVDSIQAGLRAHGVLSIIDYPGFEGQEAPDMETYSKALNAGQYPMSVLGLGERAAGLYRKGIYGNTMTANPRALDVACAVLDLLTPELRANIAERGRECVDKLQALAKDLGGLITKVQGTGLLFSCELSPVFKCYGVGSTEEYLRERGYNVIHGGANSLRFTPHFGVTSTEIDLLVAGVRQALLEGPRKQLEATAQAQAAA
jgi:acetylornithine/succinyldiaminopimelate/putrescine aminotransferase